MYIVYGKGEVGQSVCDLLRFLGKDVVIMDDKDVERAVVKDAEKIIVSPGIPPRHKIYEYHPIGEYDLCQEILSQHGKREICIFLSVTGTDGKSTTCWLLFQAVSKLIHAQGTDVMAHNDEECVLIGGNYSPSFATVTKKILETNYTRYFVVLENSSFACYNFTTFRTEYSIWTNFSPDHLNWHPTLEEYFSAKCQQLRVTTHHSYVHPQLYERVSHIAPAISSIPLQHFETSLVGEHNQWNLSAVSMLLHELAQHYGYEYPEKVESELIGLPHRIAFIAEIDNKRIYDDAKSTTSQSLQAAIRSFSDPISLIVGGSDKGDSFDIDYGKVCYAVCYGDTKDLFANEFQKRGIAHDVLQKKDPSVLQEALDLCLSRDNPIILYSPGCASFDIFTNRHQRAELFIDTVIQKK